MCCHCQKDSEMRYVFNMTQNEATVGNVRERKGNVSRGLLSDETNHGTVTEENNKIRASLITSKQTNKKPTSTATSSLASDVCNAVHVKQCSKVD